jgi:hypothetical protein
MGVVEDAKRSPADHYGLLWESQVGFWILRMRALFGFPHWSGHPPSWQFSAPSGFWILDWNTWHKLLVNLGLAVKENCLMGGWEKLPYYPTTLLPSYFYQRPLQIPDPIPAYDGRAV